MIHITADEELRARLGGFVEPVEIRDSRGKVLGVYTPALSPEEKAWYAQAETLFDLEEVERVARTEQGGAPLPRS